MISKAATAIASYSISVLNRETDGCFLALEVTHVDPKII